MREVTCIVSPSLALVKYWGKLDPERNLPATPSLSLNLRDLETVTTVREGTEDRVLVDGEEMPLDRYLPFFNNLRAALGVTTRFHAESSNNFPTSAGLASSSSGFAALTAACCRLCEKELSFEELSALARVGSASAARAFFGGFALLPAGGVSAMPLHPPEWWPELAVLVVRIDSGKKAVSSRQAMEDVRRTSPFYESWVSKSGIILERALAALQQRDLPALGQAVRHSYMSMFATMMGADPPILYWKPESVAVIRACAALREAGLEAWETMDAGPQVKVLCLAAQAEAIRKGIAAAVPGLDPAADILLTGPGPGLRWPDRA
jgi:diphosphomevalonate decarboxylase